MAREGGGEQAQRQQAGRPTQTDDAHAGAGAEARAESAGERRQLAGALRLRLHVVSLLQRQDIAVPASGELVEGGPRGLPLAVVAGGIVDADAAAPEAAPLPQHCHEVVPVDPAERRRAGGEHAVTADLAQRLRLGVLALRGGAVPRRRLLQLGEGGAVAVGLDLRGQLLGQSGRAAGRNMAGRKMASWCDRAVG